MRNVHWQQGLKSVYRGIVRPIAASLKMDDDIQETEIEEVANTSTNASPRPSCLTPGRQALADSIMKSVKASVSKLRRGDPPTIYIVPQTIRQVNEVAYEPRMVSIGPYHHGKERLQGMEENKLLYLHSFLSRNPNHRLEDYLEEIEKLEDEARSCYSEKVGPLVGNEFVKIMVLDACFIVEFFLKFNDLKKMSELLEEKAQKEKELEQKEEELEQEELKLEVEFLTIEVEFFQLNLAKFFHDDRIFRTTGMHRLIGYDLLLLENQIPFIVLQRIVKKAYPNKEPHFLAESALDFFNQFMPRNKDIQIKKIEINDSCPYYHLLHLFHSHLIPTPTNSKEEPNHSCNPKIKLKPNLSCNPKIKLKPNLSCNPKIKLKPNLSCIPKIKSVLNKLKNLLPCSNKAPLPITKRRWMIPCATDLQLEGVKFKKNEESNNILNVKFSHGVLEITPFMIHDGSETLFRNLVAFEQCCLEAKFHVFTTYLFFMDFLVNTSQDVALLHQNGIIDHLLGSDDEVAHLFNRLCIGVFLNFNASYLSDVKDNVQKHCENKWNMWRASLKRDYFTNPWSFISLIAASILLLLTITQTFFAVFPRS